MSIELRWLPGRYGVYRLAADSACPDWAFRGAFTSVSRTADELSITCEWTGAANGCPSIGPLRGIAVVGPLDFRLTGVLASVSRPLAAAGISVFCVATYDTDYVLVLEGHARRAAQALEVAGIRFISDLP